MDKQTKIIKETCLAVSTGLFTGGVAIMAINKNNVEASKATLLELFLPAIFFYLSYYLLSVINENQAISVAKVFQVIIKSIIIIALGIAIIGIIIIAYYLLGIISPSSIQLL